MRLVVTYDISDNKIRNRVYRILEKYGAWKQYSVFELDITAVQRVEMEDEIKTEIESTDKVRIYSLCDRCVKNIVDIGQKTPDKKSNIV
ncbi:CRISPR-associated protein Cas2 [Methanosarcina mazei]|jgi:CRISPR-associated protein Cas2|uniref:CRISPR-associated endoribonuclease Cas2 n=2 Tax=Methanosarcina mazei TaxID=2209 RepID=A0A0F8SW68_METMZ|nr:CRISPR-associated endonuclease Cas2 [Methanosarcina mazei]AKB63952.1 CRISPR-associated protein Cas2 [Methanosarcina mazei S-6]KKG03140.1 CRISPR-associated protein Cas2 [Methanosarcina mazei]KKG67029.1 CRISPR-associated protein Cas2 [Methanosarcina mazei]KKG76270.1 CRISPR-associated protein Cas2 [Methanosarcina mazei]KKH35543.1 CRISPR-associated protein Cas2 [Methanosarcina mazei]